MTGKAIVIMISDLQILLSKLVAHAAIQKSNAASELIMQSSWSG